MNTVELVNKKILADRAARFSQSETDISLGNTEEMIIFELADTSYAVPLGMLTELRALNKLTALPKVSPSIIGLINVRGRIVSVYKLTEKSSSDRSLNNNHDEKDTETVQVNSSKGFVLIGSGVSSSVALFADDITGTRMVSPDDIRQKPISLNDRDYIVGLGSDGLVYLDLEKFVSTERYYMA